MEETGSLVTRMALASQIHQEEESRRAPHQDHNADRLEGKKRGEEEGQSQSDVPSQVVQDLQDQEDPGHQVP